jgi:Fe-S cluster assembly iron-binding protein IscA
MNNIESSELSRRKFIEFTGVLIAVSGAFRFTDLVGAEPAAAISPVTVAPLSMTAEAAAAPLANPPISMTAEAATEILSIVKNAARLASKSWALRIAVVPDEEADYYKLSMGFEADKLSHSDLEFTMHDVPVVIDNVSAGILRGTNIVWIDQDGRRGFLFEGLPGRKTDAKPQ